MAANFHEAGIEFLLTKVENVFDQQELAVLRWLHEPAKISSAVFWDAVNSVQFGTVEWIVIQNIKSKCRQMGLQAQFEEMQSQYSDHRNAA